MTEMVCGAGRPLQPSAAWKYRVVNQNVGALEKAGISVLPRKLAKQHSNLFLGMRWPEAIGGVQLTVNTGFLRSLKVREEMIRC